MDPKPSKPNVKSPHGATASYARQPRQRMTPNYLLLWVETTINQTNEHYENTLKQIRTITGDANVFTQRDACIDFLTNSPEDIKSFLIVKDTMSQQIMPLINDIPQLDGVYIFNDIKTLHEEWTKKWQKIKTIDTNINNLCQALKIGIKQSNQDSIALSFITVNEMVPTNNLNQLEPNFMYTQIFKDILLDMKHGKQAIKQFTHYCRNNNSLSSININRFEKEYHAQLSIWWYTSPSNIYSMLNYALRTLDADTIITMGFFICHLHQQLQQLHEHQINSYGRKPFIVYRGQGLLKSDFEKLQKTKGGLISFNSFLSTSKDKEVSLEFARCASTNPDMVGILFIMYIDPCIRSTPFAFIKEMSYFKGEEEILFSMHTVFRVSDIKQMDNWNQIYQVELQLTSDDDQQLRLLADWIREEAGDNTGWKRLGSLLLKIGKFNKAEELYSVLLEQTSDVGDKAHYYHKLGLVHYYRGNYEKALWYFEQGLEAQEKNLPSNHSDLAESFNDIGLVYSGMGDYSKALSFYEKGLQIRQKRFPPNHPDFAESYNNIGSVYHNMGDYSKALSSHEKALEIDQKTLPSNHPSLATSYSNIGNLYHNMGEYSKALSYYEIALEIYQKTLPLNHPSLTTSYNNIGMVYYSMKEYSKALSFHEKALEIDQKTLPSNHPSLAASYNNIGLVYKNMGEYSKALSSHEKALEMKQITLPSNHPSLATSYSNIGMVYYSMEEYSKALSYYEKDLEICQKTLPSNHPLLATSYNNIGLAYKDMGEYSKALAYFERALDIKQRALPPTHPSIKNVKQSIEIVKKKL
ncbi:unnamed protein product [Adineta steineri]|uniref:NAD(P)(+)--arginine ADP-ribosyltransferase n=2 Tax=Adineta steineri TaxID=433720 RepID=A0A819UMZ8_9BILA|nr:unnamed protein product [Adineta steineri]CAF4096638.1 unnamed protein product [Adineta steineri]